MRTPLSSDFEEQNLAPPPAFSLSWDEAGQCLILPYKADFKGSLRCLVKDFYVNPVNILPLFFLTPFTLYWMLELSWPFAVKLLAALVMSVVVIMAIMVLQLAMARYAPSSKLKLTAEGIVDETPRKIAGYSWPQIKRMKNWDGDLFFIVTSTKRSYFSKGVFRSLDEANQFYSVAERLWKSQGADWPEIVRQFVPRPNP